VEFFCAAWRGRRLRRNFRSQRQVAGKRAMKVFVFDLLAYGEQLG
jgi:hypothetical protein